MMRVFFAGETLALWVNLNKQCISAQHKGQPVMHLTGITIELKNVRWSCPPKGFQSATKQRHVFARMRGEFVDFHGQEWQPPTGAQRVRLNSKDRPHLPCFHLLPSETPIKETARAWLSHEIGAPYPIAYGLGGDTC